jgi:hypothetical protein
MSALSRIKLAEMERLRAENERLQAALRNVRAELDEDEGYHDGDDTECEVCRAIKLIDAALSQEPRT